MYDESNALIVFVKNPTLGKVKTRLAATMGDKKALEIYFELLTYTKEITENMNVEKFIYYSTFIDQSDFWTNDKYQKRLQIPINDLGVKMATAFDELEKEYFRKVIIIGSDCLDLTTDILENAFDLLEDKQVVIGPTFDGGYYLLGFNFEKINRNKNTLFEAFFLNKSWSNNQVCEQATEAAKLLDLAYGFMPKLSDIDEEKDYMRTKRKVGFPSKQ